MAILIGSKLWTSFVDASGENEAGYQKHTFFTGWSTMLRLLSVCGSFGLVELPQFLKLIEISATQVATENCQLRLDQRMFLGHILDLNLPENFK